MIAEAFYIASTGQAGPSAGRHPADVSAGELDYEPVEPVDIRSYKPTFKGHPLQIEKAAQAIAAAERPVLYVGGGVIYVQGARGAAGAVREDQHPRDDDAAGQGRIPGDASALAGDAGDARHGVRELRGEPLRPADRRRRTLRRPRHRQAGAFAPKAKVIHIDVDPAEIGKNVHVDIPIVGDGKAVLAELDKHVEPRHATEWTNELIARRRTPYPLTYDPDWRCSTRST